MREQWWKSEDAFNDPRPWRYHQAGVEDDDRTARTLANDEVDDWLKSHGRRRSVRYANGEFYQYLGECEWVSKPVRHLGKIRTCDQRRKGE